MLVKSLLAGFALCLFLAQPIVANDAFAERQERMKTLGSEAKTMASMVKGRSEFDADQFFFSAETMAEAMVGMLDFFPVGSHGGDSAAKAKIWQNWPDFTTKNQATADAIADLMDAADAGDEKAIKKAFGMVGKSCSGCHKKYRIKRD